VARPLPAPTAEALLSHLRAQRARLRSLRADAKVDHSSDGERVKFTMGLLVAEGGRFRLEAEAPIGGSIVATVVSDGKRFAMLDSRNGRFLEGPATACNVARFLRLVLPPEEIVSVLLGSAPLEGTPLAVEWDPREGGREVLTLGTADGGSERLVLDGDPLRWDLLEAERRDAAGQVRWRVRHEGWGPQADGVRLPLRISIEEPPHGGDVRLKLRDVEVNVELLDEVFHLVPPPGLTIEPAHCAR
jgi:outer membrane lipoprotein-sorting protein